MGAGCWLVDDGWLLLLQSSATHCLLVSRPACLPLEARQRAAALAVLTPDPCTALLPRPPTSTCPQIRVFCRIRPNPRSAVHCLPDNVSVRLGGGPDGKDHTFAYDRVFRPEASQAAVFEEVSDLVQSALDGFKVCLFSYGQTGAGKTHTMTGSRSFEGQGIIPRAISKVGGAGWQGCGVCGGGGEGGGGGCWQLSAGLGVALPADHPATCPAPRPPNATPPGIICLPFHNIPTHPHPPTRGGAAADLGVCCEAA